MSPHPASNRTHAICRRCFVDQWGSKSPARIVEGEREICCFCGADTDAGIYVERDPKDTPCQGGRSIPQVLFW